MVRKLYYILLVFFLYLFCTPMVEGQIRIFKKRSQAERATRDLERRRKPTAEFNPFNPLQPMGASNNFQRDDYLWSPETAYISFLHAGNVSVSTPSRWGVGSNLELQTLLGADYWVPNFLIKKGWHAKNFYWTSRHGLYSPTPGLRWAQNEGYQSIADSLVAIPQIISMKNELIVSRPFYDQINCNSKIPFLIITGSVSLDYGISLEKNQLDNSTEHIIGSRHPSLTGNGLLIGLKLQADAFLMDDLYARGHMKYFMGQMKYNAFEHRAYVEYLLNNHFSVSGGYFLSIGQYASSTFMLLPFVDITFYFGSKPRRSSGLFKDRMF